MLNVNEHGMTDLQLTNAQKTIIAITSSSLYSLSLDHSVYRLPGLQELIENGYLLKHKYGFYRVTEKSYDACGQGERRRLVDTYKMRRKNLAAFSNLYKENDYEGMVNCLNNLIHDSWIERKYRRMLVDYVIKNGLLKKIRYVEDVVRYSLNQQQIHAAINARLTIDQKSDDFSKQFKNNIITPKNIRTLKLEYLATATG